MNFDDLPRKHYGAILADPPWRFECWSGATVVQKRGSKTTYKASQAHYETMTFDEIAAIPLANFATDDSVLFLWCCWPTIEKAFDILKQWGFSYKTCAFCWMKANAKQIDMFRDDIDARMLMGYWTRSNSEICLLGTRGKPKRIAADIRQGIIEPIRQHSRKPDCVHERIERLVAGPYLELFARTRRPGWDCWGNEIDKFAPVIEAAE